MLMESCLPRLALLGVQTEEVCSNPVNIFIPKTLQKMFSLKRTMCSLERFRSLSRRPCSKWQGCSVAPQRGAQQFVGPRRFRNHCLLCPLCLRKNEFRRSCGVQCTGDTLEKKIACSASDYMEHRTLYGELYYITHYSVYCHYREHFTLYGTLLRTRACRQKNTL